MTVAAQATQTVAATMAAAEAVAARLRPRFRRGTAHGHAGAAVRGLLSDTEIRSARTAGSWPRTPALASPAPSNACWIARCGRPLPSAPTSGPPSWTRWATPPGCWSSRRPAFSRKGPNRSGSSARTAAPLAGSRTASLGWSSAMPVSRVVRESTGSCTCPGSGPPTRPAAVCGRRGSPGQQLPDHAPGGAGAGGTRTGCRRASRSEHGDAWEQHLRAEVERALDAGVPAAGVTAAAVSGNDFTFRQAREVRAQAYVVAVKRTHTVSTWPPDDPPGQARAAATPPRGRRRRGSG
jgi:hypothetical protein